MVMSDYITPVMYVDPSGLFWETIFDIGFLIWSIADVIDDPKDWKNWAALGVDIFFTAIPFVTGGGSQVIKLANVSDDLHDLKKVTVIGETTHRVEIVAQFVNATENLYDGFKSYDRLNGFGKTGKVLAEIGGKTSNITWLFGKLRTGYNVIDIGIDSVRTARSSSYITEKFIIGIWKTRNIWKWGYH